MARKMVRKMAHRDRGAGGQDGHSLAGILKLKTFLAGHNSFEHVLHAARY